ncbi:BnaAnng03240D [Brassica napus]|uniref:BnaAnng03240D protein n=1 Tax=Brassica napus TaxID=3708 RepID=A0A078GSN2_BRANA|nr:BnaAnng03240D [Brassica napus]
MNHSCYLSNIQTVREELGEDVWSELRESTIGVIVKLKELHYIWYAKVVHHFLANQLATESSHEIWSLIDDFMPLYFCAQEKRKYPKVRVRHMIMKPVEDIYRKWDNDKIYTDLDNMIKDILNGQLNEKFLDAMPTTKCEKRKYGVAASVVPN